MTTEIMTTHQKIQEQHRRNCADFIGEKPRMQHAQHVVTSDIEQIKMALQAIIDKVSTMDLYIRSLNLRQQPSTSTVHDTQGTGFDMTNINRILEDKPKQVES